MARPLDGVPDLLAGLVWRYTLVAVVSGRTEQEVRRLLDVPGLLIFGLYGMGKDAPGAFDVSRLKPLLEKEVQSVAGAWVEDKGRSLAVHYRAAPHPEEAEANLYPRLESFVRRNGLALVAGKRVLEVAPAELPGKGSVVLQEAKNRNLARCLYAGDDRADLQAFAALDQLASRGIHCVRVGVRSEEAPNELLERSDVVVEGPPGLVRLLRRL